MATLAPQDETMNALVQWGSGGIAVGTGMDGVYLYSPAAVAHASAGACSDGI